MTDAQARAAFIDPTSAPSHVEMFGLAGALDRAGTPLTGGVEPKLVCDVLTLWFRKTWRSAARREAVVTYPYQPDGLSQASVKTLDGRLPIVITDAEELPLRAFAVTVAPALIRARLFDVLWERFRRPNDAAAAIDAFLSYAASATDSAWPDAENALGRAASLVALRKDDQRIPPLLSAFDSIATTVLGGIYNFAFACIADTFISTVLRAKSIRSQVPATMGERWRFVLSWVGETFFGFDAHYGQTCLFVLSEWCASQGLGGLATAARRRLVDHLLTCATKGPAIIGSSHASAALDHALRFGFTDLVERAKTVVQDRVLASHAEMKTHAFEFTLPPEVGAEVDDLIDGAPTAGAAVRALGALVGLCDVPVEELQRAAAKQVSQSVFAAIMPSMHMRGGKVSFLANDQAAKLREAIARNVDVHLSVVEHLLFRALQRLAKRVEPATMLHAVSGCAWLPASTHIWLERASERFHAGDMMSSGLIVSMQYEAILRELFRTMGASGLKTDGGGTLMDETLGSLFRQEALRNVLGDDHIFFVEYVLGNPELGPNLRNELAHGNATPWQLTAPRVLLLWLFVVRLTFFGSKVPAPAAAEPNAAEVATAAYYRWIEGGRVDGHDEEDWLLAAADVRRRLR